MTDREEIVASLTRTLFVVAYADFYDRLVEDGEDTDGLDFASNGSDWMDAAPATTDACVKFAVEAVAKIEAHAHATVEALYERATRECEARGKRSCTTRNHTADSFGHYLAMEFVGHGVSWSDNHVTHLDLPYGESFWIDDRSDLE